MAREIKNGIIIDGVIYEFVERGIGCRGCALTGPERNGLITCRVHNPCYAFKRCSFIGQFVKLKDKDDGEEK